MTHQGTARVVSLKDYSLDELQYLCDECKLAIIKQRNRDIRQAMEQVCTNCQKVKERIPELIELRKQIHEMQEKYPG